MNVQFESPETALDSNGDKRWKDGFDPTKSEDLNLIPNEPGVYILGVKLLLNGIETFFPLYVGEASYLKVRLNEHYINRSTKQSNDTKEIFDLSNILTNYKDLYEALKAYNDLWIFNSSITKGGAKKKHKMYCNDRIEEFLVYFQCSSYLNFCLNSDVKTSCWKDFNHKYFYNHLTLLETPTSKKIVNTYNLTKECVRDNFYFSYCILPESSQAQREVVEAQTKYYLEQLYTIYTSSDVTHDGKTEWKNLKKNNPKNTNLDFSKIDSLLIKTNDMKIVNKTEYPLVDELINSLLEKFKNQGWQFPKNLPEIYLSDEIIQLPIDKNGLQGLYPNIKMIDPNNNEAALLSDYKYIDETPIIIIYEKVLEETAKKFEKHDRYYNHNIKGQDGSFEKIDNRKLLHFIQEGMEIDYGFSFEEAKMNLFYCAVLNEISKWILVDTPKKNTWKNNPLNKKDHLHECLTALLSYWICEKRSKELKKSFNFLMSFHKKGEYNRYSEYDAFEIPSVINCISICRKESYEHFELLDLLLEISKSYKTLDSNNFTTIIFKDEVQVIVVEKLINLELDSNYSDLKRIIYDDFLNKENKVKFKSHGTLPDFDFM